MIYFKIELTGSILVREEIMSDIDHIRKPKPLRLWDTYAFPAVYFALLGAIFLFLYLASLWKHA